MDNMEKNQGMQDDDYRQEFLTNLKTSNNEAKSLNKKMLKRRLMIVTIAVAVMTIVAIILVVMLVSDSSETPAFDNEEDGGMIFDAETSMINVSVAPSTARVLIGGKEYTNGEYGLLPGKYDVLIEANGFESYTGAVTVADNHKSYVMACLRPIYGNESYYDNNVGDLRICQINDELIDASAWDQMILENDILNYTPFHNHRDGYYLDPYFDDDGNLIVELTFKDCTQSESVLQERAFEWMEERGFNPVDYTFEKTWDCED